jgi:hypothetical protein
MPQPSQTGQNSPHLIRGVGLGSATALNMIDMIGVGPFITIPLMVSAMGGPQAMLGWILGAIFAMCDGLVWAELGAAMPQSGGSYRYLREIYGPKGLGRLISFLFVWQLSFSAPLIRSPRDRLALRDMHPISGPDWKRNTSLAIGAYPCRCWERCNCTGWFRDQHL